MLKKFHNYIQLDYICDDCRKIAEKNYSFSKIFFLQYSIYRIEIVQSMLMYTFYYIVVNLLV